MASKLTNQTILVASESQGLYTTRRLLEESKRLKYQTEWLNPYEELLLFNKKNKLKSVSSGLYFHRTSGTRYDDFDLLVSKAHQLEGWKITNPLPSLPLFRQKDEQALFFKQHDLSSIPTLIYRGGPNENYWSEIKKLSKQEKYILKMVRGNQGIGVNLVESWQSLKSLLETFHAMKDQRFLIQPYLPHKKEWRVFMIKNQIMGVIERTLTKEDFRGNSKRSSGKFLKKIPSSLEKEVHKAFTASGLDYAGMDLMETNEGLKFLEINPVPGFEQMEELSGLNIARELIINLS